MNSNDRIIKTKQGNKFLLTMLNKILKTIKENGEYYKVRDAGNNYVCYMWETARICVGLARKFGKDEYIVYLDFDSNDIGTDIMFVVDTEERTVKSHSMILSFLLKNITNAPLVLKSLDGLRVFIEELIRALPAEDEENEKMDNNETKSDAAVAVVNFS
ncbi:hypothetical protein STSV1pORF67 [Sulfolobus virus STSV1]|uniref:hypothetical protein n=1 Tax=Sulfolobus virus STSV1 TaxID=285013 RepID=UPI000042B131|nr:hypothetical protein STSV1pORF67 [Sulfolobus virus STSV1]CAH04250.1 hypothetical protein [Sulfolobus virus STSV1]